MNKKKREIYTIQIPPVSKEFAIAINTAFPKIRITAETKDGDIKWNAAERKVVDWVIAHANGTEILGSESDLKPVDKHKSLLDKILGR